MHAKATHISQMAMGDSRAYLAARVLNDKNFASYRSLSRDLKVHVNSAKYLLYEFYHQENSKRPGSVYATYLVSGKQSLYDESKVASEKQDGGEDTPMQSSPFMSSPTQLQDNAEDQISINVITLAGEENLAGIKANYDEIFSVHIYSLGPSMIQNLQILSDCNRAIAAETIAEDPLDASKQYGVIQNRRVKRRTGRRQTLAGASSSAAQPMNSMISKPKEVSMLVSTKSQTLGKDPPSPNVTGKTEINPAIKAEARQPLSKRNEKKATGRTPSLKREQSDIFKSFSKPMSKLKRENTDSSAGETTPAALGLSEDEPEVRVDEQMRDSSDDGIDHPKEVAKSSKSKSQRVEELQRMMEIDGETGEPKLHSTEANNRTEEIVDTGVEDSIDQSMDCQEPASIEQNESSGGLLIQPQTSIVEGRHRGRRKVLKKKTLKDEEGYLVTKEEAVWESFSEEEPVIEKNTTPTSSAGKAKKIGGKPAQGNIMSFFGKR